jgi:hypothetical protein
MILMELPGLLFFSTYTLLVLFWAEIYHQVFLLVLCRSWYELWVTIELWLILVDSFFDCQQARSLPADKLRPAYYAVNGFIYLLQVRKRKRKCLIMLCLLQLGHEEMSRIYYAYYNVSWFLNHYFAIIRCAYGYS